MDKKLSIKNWPEGERPREKLMRFGAESLTDAELLAILVRMGHSGSSAIEVGRLLIDQLGDCVGLIALMRRIFLG